jgi:Elongation factor P, C-terminal
MPRDDAWALFLKEGTDCSVVFHNGVVISVEPPMNLSLKVVRTDPGVKGNTAQGGSKPATLETGAVVQVLKRPSRGGLRSCSP